MVTGLLAISEKTKWMGNASRYFNTHPFSVRYIDDIKNKKELKMNLEVWSIIIVSDSKILVQYQTKPFLTN